MRTLARLAAPSLMALLLSPTFAETIVDEFETLNTQTWRPANLLGDRQFPGLSVEVRDGALRIQGTTDDEAISLAGVRTRAMFGASEAQPLTVRVTRASHGGRADRAEHGVILWRSAGEFFYVREPVHQLVKDWQRYQSWQVLTGGGGIGVQDILDEELFLEANPQEPFDCKLHQMPRAVEIRFDGTTVVVSIDGEECHRQELPWSGPFTVGLVAGSLGAAVHADVAFSDIAIEGDVMAEVDALPIDTTGWEPAQPSYWRGDAELDEGAAERLLATKPPVQAAMVLRSRWQPSVIKQFIDWSADEGLNCVALDLAWSEVEREKGAFDFSRYDGWINYAVNRGLWVQLKPWWINRQYPRWISPELEQKPLIGTNRLHELTFANDGLNDHIARFVSETVRHYRGYPVTCYTPVAASAAELEYSHGDWRDASDWALDQYREWLGRKYPGRNTDEATMPENLDVTPGEPDLRAHVNDWFRYREWSLKQLVDRLGKAIHEADPEAVFAIQVGRAQDGPSCPRRASVGVFYWGESADMVIADPQPRDGDSMGYLIDTIRGNGKIAAMELDAPARFELPMDDYRDNTVDCWRHGGTWSSWANWVPDELALEGVLRMTRETAEALDADHSFPTPPTAMYVSKWDLYCYHGQDRWREYRDAYLGLTDGGRQVIDVISDDRMLAQPRALGRYDRIVVPYADCIDARVLKLLKRHAKKLEVTRDAEFGKNVLSIADGDGY